MMDRGDRKFFFATVVLLIFLALSIYFRQPCKVKECIDSEPPVVAKKTYVVSRETQVYRSQYNRSMPLIFVGGVPRSGTTLMRAMLDAHPDVRCGQETRVIPNILDMRRNWVMYESVRLQDAGVDSEVLNSAIASFCLEVIIRHGESAPRLCNKDPLVLESADYLSGLFPQSKFIFMVRDGRATAHSIVSRKVMIVGWDNTNYRQVLMRWNMMIKMMYDQCLLVGQSRCMMVYYEQLVQRPAQQMREILDFLGLPWNDSVLHHEELIDKPGGVQLAKTEPSTDQVVNPVYDDALAKWVGQIPEDVVLDMAKIAPMLAVLGYDPYANPPNYAHVPTFGSWEVPQIPAPPTSQVEDTLQEHENQQGVYEVQNKLI